MSTPELVSRTALVHYFEELPERKGKPQSGKEWTVYAAIVAVKNYDNGNNDVWVVSSATGSKCVAVQSASSSFKPFNFPPCGQNGRCKVCCDNQVKGMVIHDSHAEILARRGLLLALWKEIQTSLERKDGEEVDEGTSTGRCLLRFIKETQGSVSGIIENSMSQGNENLFKLRSDIQLHLYISDSPCGDASIYEIKEEYQRSKTEKVGSSLNFTGAKIILSAANEASLKTYDEHNFFPVNQKNNLSTDEERTSEGNLLKTAREKEQVLGALRLKSCRSNIPNHLRSMSMSCSDKLCKWALLGIQGTGPLAAFLRKPVRLSSIVVGHDPRQTESDLGRSHHQFKALERAIVVRAKVCLNELDKARTDEISNFLKEATLPNVFVVDNTFPQGLSQSAASVHQSKSGSLPESNSSKKRKRNAEDPNAEKGTRHQAKISPCGISLNWHQEYYSSNQDRRAGENITFHNVEQTVGAKGIIQAKRPKNARNAIKCTSRLSRWALSGRSKVCLKLLADKCQQASVIKSDVESMGTLSYQEFKQQFVPSIFLRMRDIILQELETSPLAGWVRNGTEGDFFSHGTE